MITPLNPPQEYPFSGDDWRNPNTHSVMVGATYYQYSKRRYVIVLGIVSYEDKKLVIFIDEDYINNDNYNDMAEAIDIDKFISEKHPSNDSYKAFEWEFEYSD